MCGDVNTAGARALRRPGRCTGASISRNGCGIPTTGPGSGRAAAAAMDGAQLNCTFDAQRFPGHFKEGCGIGVTLRAGADRTGLTFHNRALVPEIPLPGARVFRIAWRGHPGVFANRLCSRGPTQRLNW